MKTDVRILLVGEDGVGKTSLILSLISEEFPEQVPAMADEIIIPADVTPERVPTQIVDYSSRVQNEEQLVVEIKKANVICIVYSVDDVDSISKISSYWIPVIHESLSDKVYKPIVLVGNKSDIMETSSMELIMPIMNSFAEIETCVECSAKTLKNISEVFYYAQKAVLHPTAPLYVPESKELTVKCKQALTRIFKICDKDNDGLLNDEEIYIFQRRCFNVPLQPQALEDVKAVVRRHTQDGIHQECLTQKGFLFLHTLFIQRGRHETTWAVLRKFGYNDDLNLNDDFNWPQLKVYSGSSTELTAQGLQFLSDLFEKYDEDHDNCLSPTEITNLFGMCPNTVWNNDVVNSVCTNAHGWITHQGYLSYWMLQTHENVSKTLEFLAYSGYIYEHDSLTNSIYVTRDKRLDIEKRQTNRNVFKCHVFGSKGSGKTSFLQGLLNRSLHYLKTLNCEKLPTTVVNMIPVCGQEKYLVMKEIHSDVSHNNFSCDIICLVYDTSNPNSFEHIAKIFLQYLSTCWIPVCIIGCKADHLEVPQNYILQPADFCIKNGLEPPLMISCTDRINRNVYIQLATMAAYPHMHKSIRRSNINVWLKRGLLITATIGLGYILLRFARKCNR